ncbi:VOC family protein [Neobittarella massiliensis]|uniref:VOC family protein n=2 Tax=Oscillospiraceae TaxID=216572 RepID=A0A8J6IPG5_9FIRM|nr:VOC family protein [Neobittarella massiliensis]MBC3515528.1 VOC family protein [Neobittarella massiliensis]SCJ54873.1 glyoxalase I [uncultured Anaerotruncus sp.]
MAYCAKKYVHHLHHIGFVVQDLDRSVDFYTRILGFDLRDRWAEGPEKVEMGLCVPGAALELAQLQGYGITMELMQYKSAPGHTGPIAQNRVGLGHISLIVEHFDDFLEQMQQLGVPIASPVTKLTYGQWVHIVDPDGIHIEVMGLLVDGPLDGKFS